MRALFRGLLPLLLFLNLPPLPSSADEPLPVPAPLTPDQMAQKLDLLKQQRFSAPTLFDGAKFPAIDFMNQTAVQSATQSYSIRTRFFDSHWNEVTEPKAIGRYGAVIQVNVGDKSFFRRLTLYHTEGVADFTPDRKRPSGQLPPGCGIAPAIVTQEEWTIRELLEHGTSFTDGEESPETRLLAALHDIQENPARWSGSMIASIGNAWWAELDRRLGEKQDYAHLTYRPEDYDKNAKRRWPLLLFLHGSGERGANLDMVKNQGPQGYISQGHELPFIVVTPQCPNNEWWDSVRLMRLIAQVSAEYRVDPKRIYVTGLSMGGFGSFELAATYPDKIAAFASLSGGATPAMAPRLKKVPAWIFHGANDGVVPPRYSIDIAAAMKKLGEQVQLTIIPETGHEKWDLVYAKPELYHWFLDHTR